MQKRICQRLHWTKGLEGVLLEDIYVPNKAAKMAAALVIAEHWELIALARTVLLSNS